MILQVMASKLKAGQQNIKVSDFCSEMFQLVVLLQF